jgi:hypothetical protein
MDMKRRSFFARTFDVLAAAVLGPLVPQAPKPDYAFKIFTYRGARFVFNPDAYYENRIVFLNPKYYRVERIVGPEFDPQHNSKGFAEEIAA